MSSPPSVVAHKPHFHRDEAWKQPVRCATTAAIVIATGLNAGDVVDGVTLAAGDRVLVKDQAAGAENGIYLAGVTPARAYDMDAATEVVGGHIYVVGGTVNGGTLWRATNTATPTLGTTALAFARAPVASGADVIGTPGDFSVVGLRSIVSIASNAGDNTVGSVLTTIQSSPWVATFARSSNSGASAGSNSTRVSEVSLAGVAATFSPSDHQHDGIGTVTASSSNTMQRGTLNLRPGANVSFSLSDSDSDGEFDTLTVNGGAGGAGGSGVTVEEVDGTPTVTATKIVLPNGTLGVVGSVATYTPAAGGGASLPGFVQAKTAGNQATSLVLASAPGVGSTLILFTDSTTGQVSAVSSANTTWTQLKTVTSAGSSYYAIWIGVCAASAGATITMTKPGAYNYAACIEITNSVAPTLGASTSGSTVSGGNMLKLTGGTAGRIAVYAVSQDNTGLLARLDASIPAFGIFGSDIITLLLATSVAANQFLSASTGGAGAYIMCEVY